MIILPDRNIVRTKFLVPVPKREWRTPSLAQPKDQFGNENKTVFKLKAKLNDGHTVWTGVFEDREDFDAFLFSLFCGKLRYEKPLWNLPSPSWSPHIGENVSYELATSVFLTAPTGSNQTYTSPSDWSNSNNSIHCIGGGAGGAAATGSTNPKAAGGGGGGYAKVSNFTFATPGTTTATYQIGASTTGASANLNGPAGKDTWFNGTTYTGATLGGGGGGGGTFSQAASAAITGGAGGTGRGTGATTYTGGSGGSRSSGTTINQYYATGGGGAAGPNGNGQDAPSDVVGVSGTDGGAGDAGFGGAGGIYDGVSGSNGDNGTEWGTAGSGGGAGGAANRTNDKPNNGGNYGGAGGGGCRGFTPMEGGNGAQGIIYIEYAPGLQGGINIAMMGL